VNLGPRTRTRPDVVLVDTEVGHLWRVGGRRPRTVVYAYEIVPATKAYAVTGIHRGKLSVPVPFEITLDLDALPR
jgi:hypothetical protein